MSPEPGYGSADRAPGISLTWCVFALKKTWENIRKSLGKYGQIVYELIFLGGIPWRFNWIYHEKW